MDLLTYNEISCVIKLIELVNFSDNKPQNHSFCSIALESPYLSFYNTDTNSVNKERKNISLKMLFAKVFKTMKFFTVNLKISLIL